MSLTAPFTASSPYSVRFGQLIRLQGLQTPDERRRVYRTIQDVADECHISVSICECRPAKSAGKSVVTNWAYDRSKPRRICVGEMHTVEAGGGASGCSLALEVNGTAEREIEFVNRLAKVLAEIKTARAKEQTPFASLALCFSP